MKWSVTVSSFLFELVAHFFVGSKAKQRGNPQFRGAPSKEGAHPNESRTSPSLSNSLPQSKFSEDGPRRLQNPSQPGHFLQMHMTGALCSTGASEKPGLVKKETSAVGPKLGNALAQSGVFCLFSYT